MEYELKISTLRLFVQAIPEEDRTPQKIREVVTQKSSMNNFELDETQLEEISRIFENQFNVRQSFGFVVKKENSEPWWQKSVEDGLATHYSSRFHQYVLQDNEAQLPVTVANRTNEITDEIIDLAGNPNLEGHWKRRGMVIGHVQSGKTLNYSSVITKAADAGYRIIILLAGITNSLRRQTQDRIDHSFIGLQSSEANISTSRIGAAEYVMTDETVRHPNYLTSLERDFLKSSALATKGMQFGTSTEPMIFVCKKNVSTLKNIYEFLGDMPGAGVAQEPFLLIDDEADNASINTLLHQDKVTAINQSIRNILSLFDKSSYIGYTATPFANIFIDPDTEDAMGNDDLFPSDYIKTLEAPTNYVGPNEVFGEHGHLRETMVLTPTDYTDKLPLTHKSDYVFNELPNSLKEAVLLFILAKAIRISRGQHRKHCSMMVNISRFNKIQSSAHELISQYLTDTRNDIQANQDKKSYPKESVLNQLQEIYKNEFIAKAPVDSSTGYPQWHELELFKAVRFMTVTLANMTSAPLNYDSEPNGLTVIAIGGLALSRGLTLEGLTVSYILRNASAYDTLMQMGRWFGYRLGYEDICRLYIPDTSKNHYVKTTEAISELRDELQVMQDLGKTPAEFGLKVRSHPRALAITALNKMRTAKTVVHYDVLGGESEEVIAVYHDNAKNEFNRNLTRDFISSLGEPSEEDCKIKRPKLFWNDVEKNQILDFINKFEIPSVCRKFDFVPNLGSSVFEKFVNSGGTPLTSWQIAFANDYEGQIDNDNSLLPNMKLKKLFRDSGEFRTSAEGTIFYFTERRNMGTPVHASFGLKNSDIQDLIDNPILNQNGEPKQISARRYNSKRQKPLLLLYELHCKTEKEGSEIFDLPAVAFVVHFPEGNFAPEKVEYRINKVAQQLELPGFGLNGEPNMDDELWDDDSDELIEFNNFQEAG